MKKVFCTLLLAGALICTGCDVNEMTSLRDISMPYAGEYKCKSLQLGGTDLLPQFSSVRLSLLPDGTFRLFYTELTGAEGGYAGSYTLSEEEGIVLFRVPAGGEEKTFVFPYRDGEIFFELPLGTKLLHARFSANG